MYVDTLYIFVKSSAKILSNTTLALRALLVRWLAKPIKSTRIPQQYNCTCIYGVKIAFVRKSIVCTYASRSLILKKCLQ